METSWYWKVAGTTVGPLSSADLRAMSETGKLTTDDVLRMGPLGEWLPAERVLGLLEHERVSSHGQPTEPESRKSDEYIETAEKKSARKLAYQRERAEQAKYAESPIQGYAFLLALAAMAVAALLALTVSDKFWYGATLAFCGVLMTTAEWKHRPGQKPGLSPLGALLCSLFILGYALYVFDSSSDPKRERDAFEEHHQKEMQTFRDAAREIQRNPYKYGIRP